MGKLDEVVISALKKSGKALTLAEIAQTIGQPEKKVFKELRSLFEKGIIDTENRRYRLIKPSRTPFSQPISNLISQHFSREK